VRCAECRAGAALVVVCAEFVVLTDVLVGRSCSFLSSKDSSSLWASSRRRLELVVVDVLGVVLGGVVVHACAALPWSAAVLVVAGGSYEAACASDACAVPGWLTGRSRSLRSSRVVACPSRPWRFLRMMMSISPGRSESRS
jgi:hypothetical protein